LLTLTLALLDVISLHQRKSVCLAVASLESLMAFFKDTRQDNHGITFKEVERSVHLESICKLEKQAKEDLFVSRLQRNN